MINPASLVECFRMSGISLVSGVPDSLLAPFIESLNTNWPASLHVPAANEGAAVGLAIGAYLASGEPSLVYLQNSGLGNALNPIISLASRKVYGIPLVLLIGWRGDSVSGFKDEENTLFRDEPQHRFQGELTIPLLESLNIPFGVLGNDSDFQDVVEGIVASCRNNRQVGAIVVPRGVLSLQEVHKSDSSFKMTRSGVVDAILARRPRNSLLVSTTGYISREVLQQLNVEGGDSDSVFPVIGGMGHAISVAAGIALKVPRRRVICVDGDGSLCMHLGAMFVASRLANLVHLVINNNSHESVGGQPTVSSGRQFSNIAREMGYEWAVTVHNRADLESALAHAFTGMRSCFIEVDSKCEYGSKLDRPSKSPAELLEAFQSAIHRMG